MSELSFRVGIPKFGIPQVRSKLTKSGGSCPPSWKVRFSLGYPNFPLVLTFSFANAVFAVRQSEDRWGSENSHFSPFSEEFMVRQRQIKTRGILPVPLVPNFIVEEVLLKSSTPKQLPTFDLELGSRAEKRIQISSFLKLPDAESTSQNPRGSCCHMIY